MWSEVGREEKWHLYKPHYYKWEQCYDNIQSIKTEYLKADMVNLKPVIFQSKEKSKHM